MAWSAIVRLVMRPSWPDLRGEVPHAGGGELFAMPRACRRAAPAEPISWRALDAISTLQPIAPERTTIAAKTLGFMK